MESILVYSPAAIILLIRVNEKTKTNSAQFAIQKCLELHNFVTTVMIH